MKLFGAQGGADYSHEDIRNNLMLRVNVLDSELGSIDKVLGNFVQVRLGSEEGERLADVLDMWDEKHEKILSFMDIVKGTIRLSGKTVESKDFLKTENLGLLGKLSPNATEMSHGEGYSALMFLHKFSDTASAMGWVVFGHTIVSQIENSLNGWLYEDIQNGVRGAVGDAVEDFEAELEAERETRMKRKFG